MRGNMVVTHQQAVHASSQCPHFAGLNKGTSRKKRCTAAHCTLAWHGVPTGQHRMLMGATKRKPQQPLHKRVEAAAESTTKTDDATSLEADHQKDGSSSWQGPAVDPTLRSGEAASAPELTYTPPTGSDKFWTASKLLFALPWRRFKKESVLRIDLAGDLPEQLQGRFSRGFSLPVLTSCLRKAALDPRVNGLIIKISPLSMGWAKILEIRRHLEYFRASGKYTIAYMERGGEKEYLLATACEELYIPPTANLSLRGFSVGGTFLRGTLNKIGVEPQVKRIGAYKSAGDQLLREDMSDAQREQLTAILQDLYNDFCKVVAGARGKSVEDVAGLLDRAVYDMKTFKEEGWVSDLRYEDEIDDMLKKRTGGKEDEVLSVDLSKYQNVSAAAFIHGAKKAIAVIRASGAIVSGSGGAASNNITQGKLVSQLRAAKANKKISAVVLRVDSPGGEALTSDLIWREIIALAKKKPVIASMADVAASGGYYLSMAAKAIVAERLTITGSIGVVTGKFNLEGVYKRIGYNKVNISEGKYAELLTDNRSFNPDEQLLFDESAEFAYRSFRDRAAESRGMTVEDMQLVAQGRVWSGTQALEAGLVDALGGINRAILLAKEAAGIPLQDKIGVLELSRGRPSPLSLISGGTSTGMLQQLLTEAAAAMGPLSPAARVGAQALLTAALTLAQHPTGAQYGMALMDLVGTDGRPQYLMPSFTIEGAGSVAVQGQSESDISSLKDAEEWFLY